MVASHGELGAFFLDSEVVQLALLREFITQADTIVIDAEADIHQPLCLGLSQTHQQLVIVIADVFIFAPNRLPRLVEGRSLLSLEDKALEQIFGIGKIKTKV